MLESADLGCRADLGSFIRICADLGKIPTYGCSIPGTSVYEYIAGLLLSIVLYVIELAVSRGA